MNLKDINYNWNLFGFLQGPGYFFICGRYWLGILLLTIVLLLTVLFQQIWYVFALLVSLGCGFTVDHFCEESLNKKRAKLREKLIKKGFKDYDLRREIRRRESGGFSNFLKMCLVLILYWGSYFIILLIITGFRQIPRAIENRVPTMEEMVSRLEKANTIKEEDYIYKSKYGFEIYVPKDLKYLELNRNIALFAAIERNEQFLFISVSVNDIVPLDEIRKAMNIEKNNSLANYEKFEILELSENDLENVYVTYRMKDNNYFSSRGFYLFINSKENSYKFEFSTNYPPIDHFINMEEKILNSIKITNP
ncbi:MAG: hypothetical protein GXO90_03650 [FCB group bacterium]|nr:hypothetical protein [FCB group bacterium]